MMQSMDTEAVDGAARELAAARTERRQIDRLAEQYRPASDEDALAIQQRVKELLGERTGGWKCSLPRGESVFLAPLLASTIQSGSQCRVDAPGGVVRIEPEVAFVLGTDILPRATPYIEADLLHSIREARLVLEIIGSRLADPSAVPFVEFLADSLNNQGMFLGPVVPNALDRDLETLRITVSSPSGTLIEHDGRHPNGHPLRPLVW